MFICLIAFVVKASKR